MKSGILKCGFAALVAGMLASTALAAPVAYQGTLVPGVNGTGTVTGGGWFQDLGADVDYWSFHAVAGTALTIRVDRLEDGLDPAFTLYQGVTAADTSAFLHNADWGGLTVLALADDTNPPFTGGGPFEDPLLVFMFTQTGDYTIAVGGFASDDLDASYSYQISIVPEPGSLALLGLGLVGFAAGRRNPKKS